MKRDAGRGSGRLILSAPARAWLAALAFVTIVPTAASWLQDRATLESFHNRVLAPWPGAAAFPRDPAAWFAAANRWLADRLYPIVTATDLKNTLAYAVLGTSPAVNVTVARGGLVFLNGTDATHENDLVQEGCVEASAPSNLSAVSSALATVATFARRHGFAVDVIMFPTVPILYGDRLPRSFPARLRSACASDEADGAPLSRITAPAGLHFVYPVDALKARRDDPAMFPMGNFHPDGLSVRTVSDAYLRAIGAPLPTLSAVLTSGPSEVLADHGVTAAFPLYAVTGSGGTTDDGASVTLQGIVRPFFDAPGQIGYVYRDPAARDPQTILILSDSYGFNQGISLSAAFRTVVQMETPDRDPAGLIDRIRRTFPFDRLVLIFNDSNFGRMIDFAAGLSQAS